jgi:hypothetical protein
LAQAARRPTSADIDSAARNAALGERCDRVGDEGLMASAVFEKMVINERERARRNVS